ncbi:uncharacterized protein [Montipora capricornis]|uniref:uncharacterized protein n=1 Tax=Montipora capricornis TaxID=246305 RepID=UPI0035F1DEAC
MSDSLSDTSEEKNNFTRLARLIIDVGTDALRVFLHSIHPATAWPTVLHKYKPLFQSLKNRRKLFDDQWERLYPSSGDPPDTKTFDITLICLLLRKICVLTEPLTGWHEMPADDDESDEAHIVRIKCFRNDLCHSISTGIPNDEFEGKWATISRSLVALGVDSREIDRLKTETIDHNTKARIQEIMKYSWEPRISNVEDKVQQLEGQLLSFNLQEACNPVELNNCLPDESQEVFGRDKKIQEATQAIQSGKFSVVVITGAPGFGKTTVANKVAYELAKPQNGRTVFYISLKSKATLNDVTTSMFLACSTNQSHPLDNSQLWLLNWSKQQSTSVTFVLDYADHSATECQGSGSVVDLMREMRALSRQKISFVVASRRTIQAGRSQLKIKEVTLHSLWPDDAEKLLLSKVSSEGKRQKLKQTKKMVELCACVPLALCIAGSLLLDYEEDNLISRLEKEPLEVMVDDEMSLKKTIQTSFDLLNPQEQKALAILSIFPGFFDSNAAEAVISAATGSEAQSIRILRSLKTWSLLEQASSGRYHVHQLIQTFASKTGRERFRDIFEDLEMVACSHFVCRLSENSEMYWSKDRCKDSIEAFNENRHNFEYFLDVFAVAMSVKPRIDPVLEKAANKFLQQLPQKCMYLELCLLPSFYTKILHNFLRHFYTGNQPVHTVELLCFLSNEKRRVGDQKEYFDLFEQAKDIYRRNYAEFRANGLSQVLFFNSYARFLFEKCLSRELCNAVFEIALDLSEKKLADHPERAATLLLTGKYRKRIPVLQEATSSFGNHLGEHFMTAQGHKAIADVYFAHRHTETDLNMAMFHYEQAFAMMAKCGMGDRKESILTLKNYAVCHRRKGNYEDAIRILAKARHVAEVELETDHKWKVSIETQRALLYEDSGMLEEAKKIMISALKMCQRLGQPINRLGNKDEIRRFMAYHDCYPENKEILKKPRK